MGTLYFSWQHFLLPVLALLLLLPVWQPFRLLRWRRCRLDPARSPEGTCDFCSAYVLLLREPLLCFRLLWFRLGLPVLGPLRLRLFLCRWFGAFR